MPATPIMWKGFRVQLKPWRKRKRKIAATPKEGAKNQLLGRGGTSGRHRRTPRSAGEGDGVVGADADQTSDLELTQHEADQSGSAVQGHRPRGRRADTRNKSPWASGPQSSRGCDPSHQRGWTQQRQEVATFQVRGGDAVGVPGGDKGGACEPATDGQVGREEKNAGPADKNEAVALEPVIETSNHPC